jgi:RNA polymerase sigma-70 factor (ECF subfamily)
MLTTHEEGRPEPSWSRLEPVGSGPRQDGASLLRALHDEHGPALWRYTLSLTGGDQTQAQDVVQETLLRAWKNPQAFAPERGTPRAWLFTVARRIVIDEHRSARNRHETPVDAVPEEPTVTDLAQQVVDRALLTQALSRLSTDHRAVLRECYFHGRSVAEAADTLGVPPGTIKSRAHYALQALRLALEELGGVA